MKKIAVFLAEGFEEIEALTVVDICRRGGISVDTVAITEKRKVKGSHDIVVETDKSFEQADFSEYDMLVLPGGCPGTRKLEAFSPLMDQVDCFYRSGKYVAAICAAPSILGHRGILKDRRACSYPSFENQLEGAEVTQNPVEVSGHVITSRGMGTSIPFALVIVGELEGKEQAEEIADMIVYQA